MGDSHISEYPSLGEVNTKYSVGYIDVSRLDAWEKASEIVDEIVDQHPLEAYRSGPPFGPNSLFTAADQHVEHIIRVANWLLAKGIDP